MMERVKMLLDGRLRFGAGGAMFLAAIGVAIAVAAALTQV